MKEIGVDEVSIQELEQMGIQRFDAVDCLKVGPIPNPQSRNQRHFSQTPFRFDCSNHIRDILQACNGSLARAAEYFWNGDLRKVNKNFAPHYISTKGRSRLMQFELVIRPETMQVGAKTFGLLLERVMAQPSHLDTTTLSLVCASFK